MSLCDYTNSHKEYIRVADYINSLTKKPKRSKTLNNNHSKKHNNHLNQLSRLLSKYLSLLFSNQLYRKLFSQFSKLMTNSIYSKLLINQSYRKSSSNQSYRKSSSNQSYNKLFNSQPHQHRLILLLNQNWIDL